MEHCALSPPVVAGRDNLLLEPSCRPSRSQPTVTAITHSNYATYAIFALKDGHLRTIRDCLGLPVSPVVRHCRHDIGCRRGQSPLGFIALVGPVASGPFVLGGHRPGTGTRCAFRVRRLRSLDANQGCRVPPRRIIAGQDNSTVAAGRPAPSRRLLGRHFFRGDSWARYLAYP